MLCSCSAHLFIKGSSLAWCLFFREVSWAPFHSLLRYYCWGTLSGKKSETRCTVCKVHPVEEVILCFTTTFSSQQIYLHCSSRNWDQTNKSVVWTSRTRPLRRNRKKNNMTVRMSQPCFKMLQREKIRWTGSYLTFKPSICMWQDLPLRTKKALTSLVPSQALWLLQGKWPPTSEHICVVPFTLQFCPLPILFYSLCLLSSSSFQNQNSRQKTVLNSLNCTHRIRATWKNTDL